MFHPDLIAAEEEKLLKIWRPTLPEGRLVRYSVADRAEQTRRLANAAPREKGGPPSRALTQDEEAFITNERLLTKVDYEYWATGYCWINKQPEGLGRLFPLWGSQRIALDEIARLELDRVKTGHPDGILCLFLKARQLGLSTLWESILCHRLTTQTYQRGLIAGDVPEQSEYLFSMLELIEEHLPWWLTPEIRFFNKGKFRFWENFSSARVLAGKSQRGALQDKGGSKGNIGRGKTFGLGHISEVSTWEHPGQLDDGFEPGVPESRRSLVGYESTAKGRNDYWHNKWRKADQGIGRFVPVFIGWWAEPAKYWRPVTDAWEPKPTTLEHAQLVEREGPRWVHHEVRLTKEQLFWYEQKRADFEADDDLATFLSEYPAVPEEAFQFAGRSIFSERQISRIRAASKLLQVVLDVKPAREIVQGARIEAEIAARVAMRKAELQQITGEVPA